MGKKHKKKGKHAHEGAGAKAGGLPLAGLAGLVMRQAGTPEGRQAIATGLRMAADAIGGARRATGATPQAPVPPVPPVPPTAEAEAGDAKPGDAGTRSTQASVPPEMAKIMGFAASALERWAGGLGQPRDGADRPKPH